MRVKISLVVFVVVLAVWLYASGAYVAIDLESTRRELQHAGVWGGALFVMAYACLQPLGVRSIVFLLSAPMIWDPTMALLLSWVGTIGASIVSFAFARFVARDWVQQRLPRGVRRLDDRLVTHGFRTVLLLRLFFYASPALQYGLGVSRVAVGPFLMGTVLGVAPLTVLATAIGAQMNIWLERHPFSTWPWTQFGPLILLVVIAVMAAGFLAARKWQDKLSFENATPVSIPLEQES